VVLSTQERVDADLLAGKAFAARKSFAACACSSRNSCRRYRVNPVRGLPPIIHKPSLFQIMDEIERRIIIDMLERTGWNQTEAAERFSHSSFDAQPEDQTPRD